MNYEKSPLPWKARKIDCELGWVVEANNGAIIASGLPVNIAQFIAGCPNLFSACEFAISNLDSDLYVGYSSYESKRHALNKLVEAKRLIEDKKLN